MKSLCMLSIRTFIFCLAVLVAAPMAIAAEKPMTGQPQEFRLPLIRTPADVETSPDLSADEKTLALENIKRGNVDSDGWAILDNDPKLLTLWDIVGNYYSALLYPDSVVVPFGPRNLIALEVSRRSGNDYMLGFFSNLVTNQMAPYKQPASAASKLAMLDHPESKVWTQDERLVLIFTRACFENTMTDELFAQARAKWGEKQLLRYIAWMGYVQSWTLIANATGMKYLPETMKMPAISAEAVTAHALKLRSTEDSMLKYFYSLPDSSGRSSGAGSSPPSDKEKSK
jgi:hypothetical protein